jgi:hypothetical protein
VNMDRLEQVLTGILSERRTTHVGV